MKQTDLPPTTAFHAKTADGVNAVGIGNLRVVISVHDGMWFAQGMEIDYAAQGSSDDDVKKAFEDGLAATIEQYLKAFGSLEKLLTPAHADAWQEFYQAKACQAYSQVSFHQLGFAKIEYLKAA